MLTTTTCWSQLINMIQECTEYKPVTLKEFKELINIVAWGVFIFMYFCMHLFFTGLSEATCSVTEHCLWPCFKMISKLLRIYCDCNTLPWILTSWIICSFISAVQRAHGAERTSQVHFWLDQKSPYCKKLFLSGCMIINVEENQQLYYSV